MTANVVTSLVVKLPAGRPVTEIMLCAWVAQAEPGEVLEYYQGFLGVDRAAYCEPSNAADRAELNRMSNRALQLAARGLVHLVQRRLGPDSFSYLAVMRPRPNTAPLSFATFIFEEAA